jgi:hypothetical protein
VEHWWIGLQMAKIKQQELLQEAERLRMLRAGRGRLHRPESSPHRTSALPERRPRFASLPYRPGQHLLVRRMVMKRRQPLSQNLC